MGKCGICVFRPIALSNDEAYNLRRGYVVLLVLLLGFTAHVQAGEVVEWDHLIKREGLYYKKFTDVRSTVRFDALKAQPQLPQLLSDA